MPTPYELPSIMLRNARYRGHRESEKRLGSHNEQVYDIHRLANQLRKQNEEINELTNEWFIGKVKRNEINRSITIEKYFQISAGQTMFHVIGHHNLRNIVSIVVKLDNIEIDPSKYEVLHGSIYLDVESELEDIPSNAVLYVKMRARCLYEQRPLNEGLYNAENKTRNLDERIKEAERKYRIYEDAYE